MSVNLTVNGVVYPFPNTNDENWGDQVTSWATAITQSSLQKNGGTFTLSADVDFGASFGIKALYLKSRTVNVASTGIIRLAKTDTVAFRNNANTSDLALGIDASDNLNFNGSPIATTSSVTALTTRVTTAEGNITSNTSNIASNTTAIAGKEPTVTAGTTSQYYRGDKTFQTLDKTAVGLANVDNTSDANKPISTATATALAGKQATITQLPIANGGTGQTAQTAAFDALAPNTTKGDLTVRGTTNNVRLPVGTDTFVLTADSSNANGMKWAAIAASGSGTGVKNYVANPNNAAANWTASSANVTVATESTLSFIPDNSTQANAVRITRVSGTTDYVYTRFTLDKSDYNKKLSIAWDQAFGGAAGDFTIAIYSNTAANYAGTSTLLTVQTASVANGTLSFNTTFDSPGSTAPYLELRFIAAAGTTPLYLNNVTVTPGVITQGAAVSGRVSYAATQSAGLGGGTSTLQYARVGENLILSGNIVTGTVAASVASLTLPSGLTPNVSANLGVGTVSTRVTFTSGVPNIAVVMVGTDGLIKFSNVGDGSGQNNLVALNGSAIFQSSQSFSINAIIPIAEWAGNGTVNLGAGAQVQVYSSTTGTWNADAAAGNTVAGLSPITGSLTADHTKVVRLPYAPQSVSDVKVVFLPTGFTAPVGQETWAPYVATGGFNFGAKVIALSGTDVTVAFFNYKAMGTTFNTNTGARDWTTADGQWGVIIANPSAPVGFGLASATASGLYQAGAAPGVPNNSAAASGYIGEEIVAGLTVTNQLGLTSGSATTIGALTIPSAGDWQISGFSALSLNSASYTAYTTAVSLTSGVLPNADARAFPTSGGELIILQNTSATTFNGTIMHSISPYRVKTSGSITLYFFVIAAFTINTAATYGSIRATRMR